MNRSARAPAYDLMKLIVAIFLLLLFLILLWRGNASSTVATLTPLPPAETSLAAVAAATNTPPSAPSETATLVLSPTATPPQESSPTATTTSVLTATSTPDSVPTITATAGSTPGPTACELATSRSRLQVGMTATILRRLNFRSSPGIADNWLLTNIPGTKVEIVGGPTCLPHFVGAYVWWQIRLPDGRVGWSAEASLRGAFYFMESTQ